MAALALGLGQACRLPLGSLGVAPGGGTHPLPNSNTRRVWPACWPGTGWWPRSGWPLSRWGPAQESLRASGLYMPPSAFS